jgi:hypothetical protein
VADQTNKNQAQLKNARAEDGKKAMADYESQAAALRAKTERLRALRLSQEAAGEATAPKKVTTTKKTRRSKSKRPSGTLSDWLKDQERGGRNT